MSIKQFSFCFPVVKLCFHITGEIKISQIREMTSEEITEKSLEISAFCAFSAFTCFSVSE